MEQLTCLSASVAGGRKIPRPRCTDGSSRAALSEIEFFFRWVVSREAGSPADVAVALPALAASCLAVAAILEERVLERVGQVQPLGWFVLQHALDEVEELVVLLALRQQVPLGRHGVA